MGRTNIVLDERLVRRAMKLFGVKTKRRAVDLALRSVLDQETVWEKIEAARGKLHWEGDIAALRKDRLDRR